MKELRQMRNAVISALRSGGLAAEAAFPGKWAAERKTALATVSVETAEGRDLGFCGYLGESRGPSGEAREVYGKHLAGTIAVDIRAERAAECEAGGETAAAVLLGKLPEASGPGSFGGRPWPGRSRRGSSSGGERFSARRCFWRSAGRKRRSSWISN